MARLILSVAARADLLEIRDTGIRDHGPVAAEAHLRSIGQRLRMLREHPYAGQERPEFERDIRSMSCRPHRILYNVSGEVVLVIRILHQARDVRGALREQS